VVLVELEEEVLVELDMVVLVEVDIVEVLVMLVVVLVEDMGLVVVLDLVDVDGLIVLVLTEHAPEGLLDRKNDAISLARDTPLFTFAVAEPTSHVIAPENQPPLCGPYRSINSPRICFNLPASV
jgi:hypothetical protein